MRLQLLQRFWHDCLAFTDLVWIGINHGIHRGPAHDWVIALLTKRLTEEQQQCAVRHQIWVKPMKPD